MNPVTKLTLEQIKLICTRHKITYHSHSRITAGFSHEVHLLNDDLILKLFNTSDPRHFETESAMLASKANFPKPELFASYHATDEVDRSYVIMTYIKGHSLGSRWHLATDIQRESLVKEISSALRTINKIDPSEIGLEPISTWSESVLLDGKERTLRLRDKNIIDQAIADRVTDVLEASSSALASNKLYSVYWDIHFDNFIVDDDLNLLALIDLENVGLTALDYPLFVVQKQIDEPEKYLSKEDEQYADKNDYVNLNDWYKQYYPEMFAFNDLDTRIKVYQLLDTLHLLLGWSHVPELHVKLRELIASSDAKL